jgi:DNA-binding NarL/FixJ family response regulator
MEVLKLVIKGHSNGAISEALFLGESTIKAHLRGIMTKFEVNYRISGCGCGIVIGIGAVTLDS